MATFPIRLGLGKRLGIFHGPTSIGNRSEGQLQIEFIFSNRDLLISSVGEIINKLDILLNEAI